MTNELAPERALRAICAELTKRARKFALVGGLAVSVRAEVRFTRDVDLAVIVSDDHEAEIVARASMVDMQSSGAVPVANAEELLAMKVLSMTETRLQDRLDAMRLIQFAPNIDLELVRTHLASITQRGFERGQNLHAKLASVLSVLGLT